MYNFTVPIHVWHTLLAAVFLLRACFEHQATTTSSSAQFGRRGAAHKQERTLYISLQSEPVKSAIFFGKHCFQLQTRAHEAIIGPDPLE